MIIIIITIVIIVIIIITIIIIIIFRSVLHEIGSSSEKIGFLPKTDNSGHKRENELLNSAYLDLSRHQVSSQTDNFDFLDQLCPKQGIFSPKQKKSSIFELA